MDKNSSRRDFIKRSSIGLGTLGLTPLPGTDQSAGAGVTDKKLTVLCVGAHPGDPEFGCGGTLLKYSDAGHSVVVVYLNRGEAGVPSKSFAESADLRTKEAEASCKIMKARPVFAGQIDGQSQLTREHNQVMTNLILNEKPDIVFAHWPIDSHIDHQVAGILTLNAWLASGQQFHLFFYEVNTGDETMGFIPTDFVDIREVRERKKEALLAHKTQNPLVVYDSYFKTMEDFRGLEARAKAAEAFVHFKSKNQQGSLPGL